MKNIEKSELLKAAMLELLEESALDKVVNCAVPANHTPDATHPRTTLLHVKFSEDKPQVDRMAGFLWGQCVNYALSRRRRLAFKQKLLDSTGADLSEIPNLVDVVKNVFIKFRKEYPSRASEVGEVLAYCVATQHLKAAQMAAKVSLKTSSNMPVHGLDGIHASVENGVLTIYFLESKLSGSANSGAKEYAESIAGFLNDEKQYLHEYSLVGDLGNLDTLEGEARTLALAHFDVMGNPEIQRRERSVALICYSEKKHFKNSIPIADGSPDIHEKHFSENYAKDLDHHQTAASKHLKNNGVDPRKCQVFFVAVPDVNKLREKFYEAMGK
ncbi:HamA C-terminal domain-containing protein [Pseudomonas syringae]|uniref:Anti-bacteriophage protein A/HamA C-terminal domain-containing protein n=1 Tax=Pseudomonas syringae pv. aptata TaxID=83167 RepID=A0A3M3XJH9_PSEAP|nr:DUF1837 domain-containing protein [Pseudomonas syringae]NAO54869.1 DUF1837 domain-containing protein [Pseudomonas syringae]RMO70111.1 hypothetical protein ALQ37_200154 [Pseudomonas syringae pv. aptata]